MSFGLPVIAGAAGGAVEIVTDGRDGYLIAPGDAAGLAQRLNELARDRDRLQALSLEACRRFTNHPTWEETAASIRSFLIDLIEG
jgi:glycosyltransferase involved in cell wall biosynthesis